LNWLLDRARFIFISTVHGQVFRKMPFSLDYNYTITPGQSILFSTNASCGLEPVRISVVAIGSIDTDVDLVVSFEPTPGNRVSVSSVLYVRNFRFDY
jgi:hypothetical protein